ncbi:phage holin family protein [Pseudarthrobacter sp. PS3-L1]|uniref:phage holin family protein n=1 Tax=Pseudarthrobacter sp. PS3-L1 TaxID=3046207 RepID=UPI0024BB72C7|nr:phage holin family protein [Pseudarthrobacter sp. PS3-L1]MDJ0321043.1 phage holin family protein [Pseudarthrobacter sp. PS3-L1]
MSSFILRVVINALALWVATWLLPGMTIAATSASGVAARAGAGNGADAVGSILAFLFVGLIFGVINAFVRPLVSLLSLPITILTLGLFTIVINAAMLYLTAWLSSFTPVVFSIDSFWWTAVLAAIITSLVSMVASGLTGSRR